jgi:glutamate-ammonia-ligase adenylyltransferase
LPVPAYFARLSQRLISAITAPTAEGRLYDVDMRLRPSGEAGPIASHFAGFARYQGESAWTWEHMALTRARPVAGDANLCRRISETLAAVLRSPRDPKKLVIDVAAMRRRIAEENPRPSPWDLRNRRGGLIDLEFIVQYLVLRHAASSPQILRRATAEAIAALGEAGLLPPQAKHELGEAAMLFRNVLAVLTLLGDGSPSTPVLAEPDAAALAAGVGAVDFARLDADITAAAARVSSWYDRLIEQPARQAAQARGDDAG